MSLLKAAKVINIYKEEQILTRNTWWSKQILSYTHKVKKFQLLASEYSKAPQQITNQMHLIKKDKPKQYKLDSAVWKRNDLQEIDICFKVAIWPKDSAKN